MTSSKTANVVLGEHSNPTGSHNNKLLFQFWNWEQKENDETFTLELLDNSLLILRTSLFAALSFLSNLFVYRKTWKEAIKLTFF